MTLNVNEPSDQALVASLPAYIRALAVAINAIDSGDEDFATTELIVLAGTTSLVVGTDLSSTDFEVVLVTGGPATISQIRGGTQGQIKLFSFLGNSVTLNDGVKSNGELYLNQLPVNSDFSAQVGDTIAMLNIGGDGSTVYGYWKEIWRQMAVK